MSYNGWSNRETWCVKLWLDNEEWPYNALMDLAREAWEDATDEDDNSPAGLTRVETAARDMESGLRSWVEEAYDLPATGLAGDLIGSALAEVDWLEIATSYVEEVRECDSNE